MEKQKQIEECEKIEVDFQKILKGCRKRTGYFEGSPYYCGDQIQTIPKYAFESYCRKCKDIHTMMLKANGICKCPSCLTEYNVEDLRKNQELRNHGQIPAFIIDSSALKDMFEGKNKGHSDDLLKKLKAMNDRGMKVKAVTTLASFLRAIYLSDSKVEIGKVQKVLSFLQVAPSFADFKSEKEVRDEIINFAQIMSRGKTKKT